MTGLAFTDVIQAWDQAGRSDDARSAIHPVGRQGDEAYELSGMGQAQMIAALADKYSSLEPQDHRVVDFGCGDGRVLMHLLPYFGRVIGADSAPSMLDRLHRVAPGTETVLTDGIDGKLDSVQPTLICAYAVFIHHGHTDGANLLSALAFSLAPGGLLALDIPVGQVGIERATWTSVTTWTEPMLREVIEAADCEVLELHASAGALQVLRRAS